MSPDPDQVTTVRGDELTGVLDAVMTAQSRIDKARDDLQLAVRTARAAGASYTDLGSALGTTRQAAWERFSKGVDFTNSDS